MFRNRDLKTECIIGIAATVVLAAVGFFLHPASGVLLLVLGGGLTALYLLLARKRYRAIDALSKDVDRVLHGQDEILIRESEEGELAILQAQIRKMTVRLKEQSDSLLRDKRMLSDAIADLFHQIRTPLTAMNLLVSMLAEEDLPFERRLRYTRELKQQTERVQWITETLLKLSKLDAEAVRFQTETVRAEELIRNALEPLNVALELKNVAVTVEANGAAFSVDRAWTVEAVSNLLKNCMEHTPGGGSITIETSETPLFSRLTVRDTGPGFSEGELGHVFERFYRGKNAASDSVGIGLALAREIVAGQNGTLTAKNADGGGAIFTVTFYRSVI